MGKASSQRQGTSATPTLATSTGTTLNASSNSNAHITCTNLDPWYLPQPVKAASHCPAAVRCHLPQVRFVVGVATVQHADQGLSSPLQLCRARQNIERNHHKHGETVKDMAYSVVPSLDGLAIVGMGGDAEDPNRRGSRATGAKTEDFCWSRAVRNTIPSSPT